MKTRRQKVYGIHWYMDCTEKFSLAIRQGGHCPGNQGNQGKVRESGKLAKKSGKSQGI